MNRIVSTGVGILMLSGVLNAAENIALGKRYELSHEPSYKRGTEPGDATDLTDGKHAPPGKSMWMTPACVGWTLRDESVGITLDLGRVEPLSGFALTCAAGCAGVTWPDFINVYVSTDRKVWTCAGNLLAKSYARTGAPATDRYSVYRAFSDEMPAVGRYVCFTVYNHWMRFIDEIEVFRGDAALLQRPPIGFTTDEPLRHDAFLRTIDPIMQDLTRLKARAEHALPPDESSALAAQLDALMAKIGTDDGSDPRERMTTVPLTREHALVLAANARLLRKAGFAAPAFWSNNRWENLNPMAIPTADNLRDEPLTLELMRGETRSTAINVMNPTDEPLECVMTVSGMPATANINCREVVYTLSRTGVCVSGAIAPSNGAETRFTVPAGCSKQVWITAERAVGAAGTFNGKVTAVIGGRTLERELTLTLHDCTMPRPRLHVGGWADLDNRGEIAGCFKESIPAELAMMRDIYADTPFATRRVMPKGAKFDEAGALLNGDALDFNRWEKWAAMFPDARLYAVFAASTEKFEGESVFTPRGRRMLTEYAAAWAAGLERRGVPASKVVLHLVDEARTPADDRLLIAWATAIKAGASGFQVFTDPNWADPTKADPQSYSVCDIICPQIRFMDGDIGGLKTASFYTNLVTREQKTLWLYSCSGPIRELDPITYMRGQCWLAWQTGAKASCYWQFGCGAGIGDSWHAWKQTGTEYSPYFVSPDGARHWHAKQSEGLREGVQDYEYFALLDELVKAAKAAGREVGAAERLLAEGIAEGLNQRGRPGAELTTPDSDWWKDEKPRGLMDDVRLRVLREIVRLRGELLTFNAAGAWVTGVKFAWGANKDRDTPPPDFVARFVTVEGATNDFSLGKVCFKDRHWMQRQFTDAELLGLVGAKFVGFCFTGLTPDDEGVIFKDGKLFLEELKPIVIEPRGKRNLTPLPGQDIGINTGAGVLPFPTREKTVQPIAASAKPPLAIVPHFTGGVVKPAEAVHLQVSERREGRCLIVDLFAPPGKVTEITTGAADEAERLGTIRVPYLTFYGEVERLKGGLFRYALFDWYRSNASLIVTNADGTVTAKYLPKLDGSYNPVCERIVITLSDDFTDVLPEIPNPPSPHKRMVGSRLWRSHAASDRTHDRAFWRYMYDNGIRQVCVMDHETMWRDSGEAFTFCTEAARGRGGDEVQKAYTRFMNDELGYVYGPYNNYTDFQPNNDRFWNPDFVSREADGSLAPAWLRSYNPKVTAILPLCERIVPEAQAKFGFRGAYCDVHTAERPWDDTDYDARCPGAATFSQVYYAYGEMMLRQRELWNGPVWSEGGMHFMYAGLSDGNYGQDYFYDFYTRPWLVDFDLLKIHPLESDFGMGSLSMFSHALTFNDLAYYLPGMPEGRDRLVDSFLAATLAFGHNGLLIADWCWQPAKMFGPAYCGASKETFEAGVEIAKRSYFLTQAIAARYSVETVEAIRYYDENGVGHDTTAALLNGAINRRQLYVQYTGGVHVIVNGNASERFCGEIAGRRFELPSYGFLAWTDDGQVETSITDAPSGRRYFAKSPDYTYDQVVPRSSNSANGGSADNRPPVTGRYIDRADADYLRRKWRENVTDNGLGIPELTEGALKLAEEKVTAGRDWQLAKAETFAWICDNMGVGASEHDFFRRSQSTLAIVDPCRKS